MTDQAARNWLGGVQDVPPNLELVTVEEFFRLLSDVDGQTLTLYRQLAGDVPELRGPAVLFVDQFDQTGFGFVKRQAGAQYTIPDIYFTFAACRHVYRPTVEWGTLRSYECAKCRHEYSVDSSG